MTSSSTCPEPDVLAQYVDDGLVPDIRVTVDEHIDGCEDCRATVSILARAAVAERRASQPALPDPTEPDGGIALEATQLEAGAAPERPTYRRLRRIAQSPLAPGTLVGRYVIGEALGTGGMGVVYAARDPELDRDIAIKVLRPEFARVHPDATKRIIREAQAMARLSHPNVVSVHDVGTVEDRVFVAMERVAGTNLREWLAREKRSAAEILETFTAAGRGLIAAHDAGLVHRDFKPDNVLVGGDGRPRVTDFGLAYDQADDDEVDPATDESAAQPVAGTPSYMAPEQHEGGNLDARTDQFSFAVALYEALYGQRPFAGKTREALADAIAHGEIQPAPAGSRVPASLRAILVRALSAKPGDRFPTLAHMLKALGRDRARIPRQVALLALVGLIVVGVAFAADLVTRDRTTAITRTSFRATRIQLEKLVALRTDAFVSLADALYRLPAVEEVISSRDLVDFGLGDAEDDRRRLQHMHDNLSSADWLALTRTHEGDVLALADGKGRLMFGSANADAWGGDVTAISVLGAAFAAPADTYIGVVDGADPAVVASGLLGGAAKRGLYVLFTRARRIGPRPRGMFVQAIEAGRLLQEVSLGDDARLALLAPDGSHEGSVPPEVLKAARSEGIAELEIGDQVWLAEGAAFRAGDQRERIAQLVLARETDVGLAGLFPRARVWFAVLAVVLAAVLAACLLLARLRDLARR